MKKILFVAAACVALASCSKEEIVSVDKGAAIGFDTFVENSTRANDITKANLSQFSVYGSVVANDNEGFIFKDQTVTKSGDAYTYSPIQYWVPGADYKFSAFASLTSTQTVDRQWSFEKGANAANGTIVFDNQAAEANQDLVYAYETLQTAASITAKPAPVGFTFNHMLSRVMFTITNGFTEGSNIELDITDLTITNAHSNGRLGIINGTPQSWAVTAQTFARNFGSKYKLADNNTSWTTEHFYLIPVDGVYNVAFDVTLHQAGVEVDTYHRTATVTLDMEKGKSYNIKATLNTSNTSDDGSEIYPIEFTVDAVEDWEDFGDVDATIPEHLVATPQELATAVAEGGAIVLTQNINLDAIQTTRATYGLFIEKDCVIDGAGHTFTSTSGRAIAVSGANAVTLKNFTLAATGERGIQVQDGAKNVTIENVTATSANYTVSLPSSAGATVVTINNCDLKGLNTVNIAAPGANVTINDTTLRCEDNAATEDYSVVCINKSAVGAAVTVNGGEVIITGSNPDNTCGGSVEATDATLTFNETQGNTTIRGYCFAIEYGDYYYSFPTFEAAYEKALEGETIVLLHDVTIDNVLKVADKKVTFNLNGHNISSTTDVFEVAGGALTIIGDGEVHAATTNSEPCCAVWAYGEAVVNINGGTYKIGYPAGDYNDLIYAKDSAVINIYGGTFHNSGIENSFVLNLKDGSAADINVYGGSYEKFNPANNKSEGANTNFVVEGKTVEQNGDWYIVK